MQKKSPLVLDIGTETIKAGFLKNTALQYYEKFGEFIANDPEKEEIKKAALKVINEVQDKAGTEARTFLCGLPPEVLKAKIAFETTERKNPQEVISQKEEEAIRQELFKKNQKSVAEAFSQQSGIASGELNFVYEIFLEKSIDGYPVPFLKGYKGKKVGVRTFSVFSPRNYFEAFQQIFRELNLQDFKIVHPGQNLSKVFKNTNNAVFIDVGGEVTQLFIIKDGKLADLFDFSMGGINFSKAISQTFGLSEQKARAFKESYAKRELAEDTRVRVREVLWGVAEEWFFSLKSILKASGGLLPPKVFLFGGASQLPEISEALESLTEEVSVQLLKNPQLTNLSLISYEE